jgi:hypothetical protein
MVAVYDGNNGSRTHLCVSPKHGAYLEAKRVGLPIQRSILQFAA